MGNTILVIDDDNKIRGIYQRLLSAEGYDVITAPDAKAGCREVMERAVDLVLLDIQMPGVKGNEVYEAILSSAREVKIIVSSVYSVSEQKQIIPSAYGYYDKSQGTELLLEKVREAFCR